MMDYVCQLYRECYRARLLQYGKCVFSYNTEETVEFERNRHCPFTAKRVVQSLVRN